MSQYTIPIANLVSMDPINFHVRICSLCYCLIRFYILHQVFLAKK